MFKFLIVIVAIIVLLILWFVSMYNGFVKANNNCEEAYSTMDVYMKKRYDLIPNLVETVKGYAKHEAETLQNVVAARNAAASAGSVGEKIEAENALSGTLRQLFAVAEAYPDLKANQNVLELQTALKDTEDKIAYARQFYNDDVKQYKNKIEMFPSNIVAGMAGFHPMPYYEISEAERENVSVKF